MTFLGTGMRREPVACLADYPPTEAEERLPYISYLFFVFIFLVTGSTSAYPWNYIVKILGAVLVAAFAVRSIAARVQLCPETLMYLIWVIWSTAGAVAGANLVLYVPSFQTVFQICLLLFLMTSVTRSTRALSLNLFGFLLGAFWVWAEGALTGSYARAVSEGERATGMAMDANGFAWLMILAAVAMAHLWMTPSRWKGFKHPILALGLAGATVATILSGSRFNILGLAVFYLLWAWMCYRREMLRRPSVLLVVVLAVAVGGYGSVWLAARTSAGKRFQETWLRLTGKITTGGSAGRIEIYREALSVIANHPLTGVGLNNFILYSTRGAVAHSEFTEVAADTGIPGAMIYFTIYYLVWRRAGRIAKYSPDPGAVRIAKLVKAYLVVMLFVGLGVTHYYNKFAWMVLGSFIGWSQAAWGKLREQIVSSQWDHTRAYDGYAT